MSSSSSSRRRVRAGSTNVFITNAVYFPNTKIYEGYTPAMVNYACVNQVYYAYAQVATDGTVFLADEMADMQYECDGASGALGSLMRLKQTYSHLSVILTIGGSSACEIFPMVASQPFLRENFARSARGLVDASGLDGIDIAWEYPSDPQQGADFAALLATVRMYLPAEHFLLTAVLPAGRPVLQNIDIALMASYLDFVNLEAYDFCGSWSHKSGHQSPLYSMSKDKDETSGSSGVSYLMRKGCPAKKILLGIPVYGRSFMGVSGPGHRFKGVGGMEGMDGVIEYNQLPRKHAKESFDKRIGAASCLGGDGGWVSYDNPESVKMKAAFCKQKGLGGLFYYTGPADSQEKSRSLIAAGFKALHSSA